MTFTLNFWCYSTVKIGLFPGKNNPLVLPPDTGESDPLVLVAVIGFFWAFISLTVNGFTFSWLSLLVSFIFKNYIFKSSWTRMQCTRPLIQAIYYIRCISLAIYMYVVINKIYIMFHRPPCCPPCAGPSIYMGASNWRI